MKSNQIIYCKILFLLILLFLPFIGFLGISYYQLSHSNPEKSPWVSWTDDPQHKIILTWEKTENHTAEVRVKAKNETNFQIYTTPNNYAIQQIEILNLMPHIIYDYDIRSVDEAIPWYTGTFQTAPDDNSSSFSFGLVSDIQQPKIAEGHWARVARGMATKNLNFFAVIGDFVDEGQKKYEFDNFFNHAQSLLNHTALIPVKGNHDYDESPIWFNTYFPKLENRSQFFYSFNYSQVHFTVLEFSYANMKDFSIEQMDFITQDFERAKDKPYHVVMFHCPVYASGLYGPNTNLRTNLEPILMKYNVSLVVSGHEHHYERLIRNNITYLIVGGGGGLLDPGIHAIEGSQQIVNAPSYAEIIVDNNKLILNAWSPEGILYDSAMVLPRGGN